ncbi:MAG: M15 family metallopeptidase [Bdellovibrionota bacterium]
MKYKEKIATISDLESILIVENGEPLVKLTPSDFLDPSYEREDMVSFTGHNILVRYSVAKMLNTAAVYLNSKLPDSKLKIAYGYRHPIVQKKYFNERIKEIKLKSPGLNTLELKEEAHKYTADPIIAGHPTGGAVDVNILINDIPIDMGGQISDFKDKNIIRTFSDNINKTQRYNRLLLREVMLSQGFAPYDGEWWHFSYGDREWAFYYNKSVAIYDQINL